MAALDFAFDRIIYTFDSDHADFSLNDQAAENWKPR